MDLEKQAGKQCVPCRYDAERDISRLAEGWVSRAAAQQRRGRAGRVQPGVCFKLFSHAQAALMQVGPSAHANPLAALTPLLATLATLSKVHKAVQSWA